MLQDQCLVTYRSKDQSFQRVFTQASLEEMKHTVREKLGVASQTRIELVHIRDGLRIDLNDGDDFRAFQVSATRALEHVVEVRVATPFDGTAVILPFAPETLPAKKRKPRKRRKKQADLPTDATAAELPPIPNHHPSSHLEVAEAEVNDGDARAAKKQKCGIAQAPSCSFPSLPQAALNASPSPIPSLAPSSPSSAPRKMSVADVNWMLDHLEREETGDIDQSDAEDSDSELACSTPSCVVRRRDRSNARLETSSPEASDESGSDVDGGNGRAENESIQSDRRIEPANPPKSRPPPSPTSKGKQKGVPHLGEFSSPPIKLPASRAGPITRSRSVTNNSGPPESWKKRSPFDYFR